MFFYKVNHFCAWLIFVYLLRLTLTKLSYDSRTPLALPEQFTMRQVVVEGQTICLGTSATGKGLEKKYEYLEDKM